MSDQPVQGNRNDIGPHLLKPGEYCRRETGIYYACTPNGLLANLGSHSIVEHEDGTISVTPSILVRDGQGGEWHGYLTNGVWREC